MKMFNRSLLASSIIASLCITPAALADDIQVKISNSLLDTYTDKYEEADLVVMKLSDIRVAAMAYWSEYQDYPAVINDLVADSFYFGTFTTTFGTAIGGTDNDNSYALTIDMPSPELASYVASNVNGTFIGNTVTLEFGLPMSAVSNDVTLARFADPDNPDLNTMNTDINMNGNNIDNVGTLTTNNATVNGDLIVNSGTNTLEMTASGLSYNGSEVVTEDNISTFADTSDLVSKTEDAVMNGHYTISGAGSSLNINDSKIGFQSGGVESGVISSVPRGVAIGRGGNTLLEIGDGASGTGLIFTPTYVTSKVSLNAKRYSKSSSLNLSDRAVLKSAGGQTWIGAHDGRIVAYGGASSSTNIAAADNGRINLMVGQSGYQSPDYALVAGNDSSNNAYVSLMYNSVDKLSTNADGVNISGAITANGAGGNYLNLSEGLFTYQGNDVLTAGNFMNYAASNEDAVSKTQDGTLRGLYTIDGLEEDGVTPSGAGLNFVNNGAIYSNGKEVISFTPVTIWNDTLASETNISGRLKLSNRYQDDYFVVGDDFGLTYKPRQIGDTGVFIQSTSNNYGAQSYGSLEMDARGGAGGVVLKHTAGNVNIGANDNRFGSYGGGSSRVRLYASESINLRIYDGGFSNSSNVDEVLVGARDELNGAFVGLKYQGNEKARTTTSGLSLSGNLTASYDSNADGTADTEYFNLSESAFTYNGADVITAANIGTYAATAEDAVSKTQDGTLRGLYTIDGLEADGVTPSGAGLDLANGASQTFTSPIGTIVRSGIINGQFTLDQSRNGGSSWDKRIEFDTTTNNKGVKLYADAGSGTNRTGRLAFETHAFGISAYSPNTNELIFEARDSLYNSGLRYIGGGVVDLRSGTNQARLLGRGDRIALYAHGTGTTFIGSAGVDMNSYGSGSDFTKVYARKDITFNLQYDGQPLAILSEDISGTTRQGYVSLRYYNNEKFRTTVDGVFLNGDLIASYDSDADGIADTEYFNLSQTAFTYNGAEVITAANIGTYAATAEDAVSKTQDGTLRGLYTFDGLEADGVTPSGAGLRFVNGAFIDQSLLVKSDATELLNINTKRITLETRYGSHDSGILLKAINGTDFDRLTLSRGNARLYSSNGNTFIGTPDSRINVNGNEASNNVFIGASNEVKIAVQNSGVVTNNTVLRAYSDPSGRSAVDLEYEAKKRLSTNADGVDIAGNFIASFDSDADGIADTEYLNLSQTAFTYNGADVITAANIGTYAATAEDAVSKTQDGTLRGLYTIDGLEADGVTPSGAGLNFINGAKIIGDVSFQNNSTVSEEYLNISGNSDSVILKPNNSFLGALSYRKSTNAWATQADLSVASINTDLIDVNHINAQTITVNSELTVDGIAVAEWIRDCEAGVAQGCSTTP